MVRDRRPVIGGWHLALQRRDQPEAAFVDRQAGPLERRFRGIAGLIVAAGDHLDQRNGRLGGVGDLALGCAARIGLVATVFGNFRSWVEQDREDDLGRDADAHQLAGDEEHGARRSPLKSS